MSDSFNPLRALYSTFPLVLPNPAALPLDNLSKCRGILPVDDPEWRDKDPKTQRLLEVRLVEHNNQNACTCIDPLYTNAISRAATFDSTRMLKP